MTPASASTGPSRFRFRAWQNGRMYLFGLDTLTGDVNGGVRGYPTREGRFADGCVDLNADEPPVLMQSTGLTDKNGKEVFEGDILRHRTWGPLVGSIYGPDEYHYLVCEWFAETARWTLRLLYSQPNDSVYAKNQTHWDVAIVDGMQVSGSIHENPELLSSAS